MSSESIGDIIDMNARITDLENRLDNRISSLQSNVVDVNSKLDSKLDMLIQMMQRSFDETTEHKKDVQNVFARLDERIETVAMNVQQTKLDLHRNIAEQNVRIEETVNTVDTVHAAQERQYDMMKAMRERIDQVHERVDQVQGLTDVAQLRTDLLKTIHTEFDVIDHTLRKSHLGLREDFQQDHVRLEMQIRQDMALMDQAL